MILFGFGKGPSAAHEQLESERWKCGNCDAGALREMLLGGWRSRSDKLGTLSLKFLLPLSFVTGLKVFSMNVLG
jgi:hypothetical protein